MRPMREACNLMEGMKDNEMFAVMFQLKPLKRELENGSALRGS